LLDLRRFFDSGTAEFLREDGLPHHNSFYIGCCVRKGKNTCLPPCVDPDANRMRRIGRGAKLTMASPECRKSSASRRGAGRGSSVGLSAAPSARHGVWTESPNGMKQKSWLLIAKI
jgi:hypothetical protein